MTLPRQPRKRARSTSRCDTPKTTTPTASGFIQLETWAETPRWAETLQSTRETWRLSTEAGLLPTTSRAAGSGVQKRARGAGGWVPLPSSKVSDDATTCTSISASTSSVLYDRYDVPGSAAVNELVLRHVALPASPHNRHGARGGEHDTLAYYEKSHPTRSAVVAPVRHKRARMSEAAPASSLSTVVAAPAVFALHRYTYNLVKSLVHPLHNFLQLHHGLHNADEIQVMLMPKTGPIAEADLRYRRRQRSKVSAETRTPVHGTPPVAQTASMRRCYVATNQETLTAQALESAVANWGVPGVLQISDFSVVHGRPGRHAELKLLEYLHETILGGANVRVTSQAEKVLVAGERLPCAVCRLLAVAYEGCAQLLPSHGHFYMTAATTELLEESSRSIGTARVCAEGGVTGPSAVEGSLSHSPSSWVVLSPQESLRLLCHDTPCRALH